MAKRLRETKRSRYLLIDFSLCNNSMDNLEEVDLDNLPRVEEDDAVSYGDVTVRRSHVSKKPVAPVDRTGASLVDLQLFTSPMQSLRGVFSTEAAVDSQLPNVEEYKVQSAYTGRSKRKGFSIREFCSEYGEALFMGVMVLLILIGSIIVGSVWLKDHVNNDASTVKSPGNVTSGANLTGDIVTHRPHHNSDPHHNSPRFPQLIDFISGEGWTSKAKLTTEGSPQMRAALWLADFDTQEVPIENSVALRERYALAVLHFAANGRTWSRNIGFLSDADVCDWAIDGVKNKDGETIRLGVDCTCRFPRAQKCNKREDQTVKRLLLPSMNLEGIIPHEIYLLYDLIELDLNSNRLHGELSQGLLLLRSLRFLSLHYNRLEGGIPKWIGDMTELREINLASNNLSGDIPDEIGHLESLYMLNLNDNKMTGTLIPLQRLTKLQALFLGDNQFSGPFIPQYLDMWPELTILDISDNLLGYKVPANLFYHPTLRVVDLHGNAMTGSIPEVSDSSMVEFLALQDNMLEGPIPLSISNLDEMYHLDLSNNRLTGHLPINLEGLKKLEYLFLAFNPFEHGIVPHFLASMTNLRDLSLQRTNRNGKIPPILGRLTSLTLMDLGDNALSGEIPSELGSLTDLRFMILYRNYLTGAIPTEIHQLDKLTKMVLHDNAITERADYMCTPPIPGLELLMECDKDPNSDYPYCPCCKCCIEKDVNCNTLIWFGSLDPAWDTEYVRTNYKFHENDIPYIIGRGNA